MRLAAGVGREEALLRKEFSKHYSKGELSVDFIEQREFGFGGWERKIEYRHLSFKSALEFKSRLVSEAPLYVSYSVARYKFPEARPMANKGWMGADLVFDLDAGGEACGGKCGKFTCKKCLDAVKSDAVRLVEDFLIADFGLSKSEISVNFSGGRGYHVHAVSSELCSLGRESRREIADYIAGIGLDFGRLFWEDGKKLFGPSPSQGGYGGKFARAFIEKLSDDEFARSFSPKLKDPGEREKLRKGIEAGNWDSIGIANRKKKLKERFEQMKLSLTGRIDANVTADTTKLIRVPNSLHGGSGLLAKKLGSFGELSDFDPMRHSVAFAEGELRVLACEDIPPIEIGGLSFGAMGKGEKAVLPKACAIYLICKKAAVLAD